MDMRLLLNLTMDDIEEPEVQEELETMTLDLCTIIDKLQSLAEKMRSHTEDGESDDQFSYGVEDGMQRSAEMIENLINQLNNTDRNK